VIDSSMTVNALDGGGVELEEMAADGGAFSIRQGAGRSHVDDFLRDDCGVATAGDSHGRQNGHVVRGWRRLVYLHRLAEYILPCAGGRRHFEKPGAIAVDDVGSRRRASPVGPRLYRRRHQKSSNFIYRPSRRLHLRRLLRREGGRYEIRRRWLLFNGKLLKIVA
jgi:hypothetical protein